MSKALSNGAFRNNALLRYLKLSFPSSAFKGSRMQASGAKAHTICSMTKHSITSPTLMSLNFSTCMPHS